jgi:hypothetical protein
VVLPVAHMTAGESRHYCHRRFVPLGRCYTSPTPEGQETSEVGPHNSELARSYDAYSAAATMVSSISYGWGSEKVLVERIPSTGATTPRGRGLSKPGTGPRVEIRLETAASLPERPACMARLLTWVNLIRGETWPRIVLAVYGARPAR